MPEAFLLRYLVDRETTVEGQWCTTLAVNAEGSDTINAAISAWRDAFAEQTSLPLLTYRGWKPLPQYSSSQTLQLGEKDDHLHDLATVSRA